jgi:HTH-type transcriptional regulator, transcriptional repressor of NAD biosynthesis genes
MIRRFGRGLVVGKLSPLHRGHEHLLTTALAQCERVYCLSYSHPELPGCSAEARRRWLAELFPSVQHVALDLPTLAAERLTHASLPTLPHNGDAELVHRQFVAQVCLALFGTPVDAVFTSELYGEGFAQQLQQDFRAAGHVSCSVAHVLVDLERRAVPISASQLRSSRALHERFLSPVVRQSFVTRVCVLGGESSGKTTLTRRLAAAFASTHVEEYGRELWLERGGSLAYDDYLLIARTQLEREEQAARSARDFLFCDTSPLTTLLYCLDQFGRAEPELDALAKRAYDLILLCAPDFPFVQDGTRRDAAFRARQHELYVGRLSRTRWPWLVVCGEVEARIEQVRRKLAEDYGC